MRKWESYEWLAIIGSITMLVTGYARYFVPGIFKDFVFEDKSYQYFNWEFIWLEGEDFGKLCWVTALWILMKNNSFAKKAMQWVIDFLIVDMYFVYAKNPYVMDDYRNMCYLLATITFIVILIFGDYFIPFVKKRL